MELFFLSDAMAALEGREETAEKGLVYCETMMPLLDVFQRMVSPSAETAILPPATLSGAP